MEDKRRRPPREDKETQADIGEVGWVKSPITNQGVEEEREGGVGSRSKGDEKWTLSMAGAAPGGPTFEAAEGE